MKNRIQVFASLVLTLTSTTVLAQFNPAGLKDCTSAESACFQGNFPQASFQMVSTPRSDKLVVLFHGLSDSPFYMKDVAQIFRAQGYDVVAPTLDGHGTKPEDLLKVKSKDWIATSDAWMSWALKNWKQVSVGGFSTGGALSVRLAAKNSQIKDVFLFAPAIKIKDPKAFQSCIPLIGKTRKDGQFILSKAQPTPVKYNKKTLASVCALYSLTQKVKDLPGKIRQPIWAAVSADDDTVNTVSALSFLNKTSSPARQILLLGSDSAAKTVEAELQKLQISFTGMKRGKNAPVGHGEITIQSNVFNPSQLNHDFQTLEQSLVQFIRR